MPIKAAKLTENTTYRYELALDGKIRDICGALPIADSCRQSGFKKFIFPHDSAMEAVDLDGATIYGVHTLADVIAIINGAPALAVSISR